MKRFYCIAIASILSACATSPVHFDPHLYSKVEIDAVVAHHFDTNTTVVSKALAPSFEKFGQPARYVEGDMSGVDNDRFERLYGTGKIRSRFKVPRKAFWQIDGNRLGKDVSPVRTVHLIYNQALLDGNVFLAKSMETRRGQTFTVFERQQDSQIIVSVYKTSRLPKAAEFKTLELRVD